MIVEMLLVALVLAPSARGETLLRDDFDASVLDTSKWHQAEGCGSYYGRTQIRPSSHSLASVDGALQLLLDSYNPSGLSFFGSEIVSNAEFAPAADGGISLVARVRLRVPTAAGLDAALFLYRIQPPADACDTNPLRDEIDFELLTSQIGSGKLLTNVYDGEAIGGAGAPAYPVVAGFAPRAYHELELRWWADRIEWRVDGALVRVESERVPSGPMAARLNFWAPAADFPEAFASPPDATSEPGANEQWLYEVDWVEVATIPEPRAELATGCVLAALFARSWRSGARGRATS